MDEKKFRFAVVAALFICAAALIALVVVTSTLLEEKDLPADFLREEVVSVVGATDLYAGEGKTTYLVEGRWGKELVMASTPEKGKAHPKNIGVLRGVGGYVSKAYPVNLVAEQ